jgi:hypothetical protein
MEKMLPFMAMIGFVAIAAAPPSRQAPAADQAAIPFVDLGNIYNFEVENEHVVYLEDRGRHWYRAELANDCLGLPWANRIGIDTHGGNRVDQFAELIVDGQGCRIASLTRSEKPAPRHRGKG